MANAIPMLEGTDASGGYLVPDSVGTPLINTIRREAAVFDLSRIDRVPGKRQKYNVYAGRPTAAFVDEAAAKPTTGAEFAQVSVDVKKIATQVIYTEELLEDAQQDPRVLVSADVEGAIADLIDAHALGYAAGSAITGQFNSELTGTTSTVELGTGGDAFAVAVSAALSTIEGNGGRPNGIVAASDVRGLLRDARSASDATVPVFTNGFGREPDSVYGLPIRYTSNLDALPAGAGKIAAVVGDFTHSVGVIRSDLNVRFSDQATIDVGGTLHHLWQQNKVAAQWEVRVGYFVHDINRMFVAITNAS